MDIQGRTEKHIKPHGKKSVDIKGKLMFLSSVHRISGGDSFFLMKVEDVQEPVVVNDENKMHWWESLQPFKQVSLGSLKRTTMNKGTEEERKVLTTTAHSTLSVPKSQKTAQETGMSEEKPPENSRNLPNANDGSKFKFISYTGKVTDCSMINTGIVELDSKVRLVISHQPCLPPCHGLRVGSTVTVYNCHLVKFQEIIHLFCCTSTTVKVTKSIELESQHLPPFASQSLLTRACQEINVMDYLLLVHTAMEVHERLSLPSQDESARLSKRLLASSPNHQLPVRRDIFQEFCSVPHECPLLIFNQERIPKVVSLRCVLDILYEKIHAEGNEWFNGTEYDRLNSYDGPESLIAYCLMSDKDFENTVITGEVVVSGETGNVQLKDSTALIDFVFLSKEPKTEAEWQRIYLICLADKLYAKRTAIVVLRRYQIVVERFQNSVHSSPRDKIYITADVLDPGNEIFPLGKHRGSINRKRKCSGKAESSTKKLRFEREKSSTVSSGTSLSGNEPTRRPQVGGGFKYSERWMTTYGKNLPQDEDAQDDSSTKKLRFGSDKSSTVSSTTSLSGNDPTRRPQAAEGFKHSERYMTTYGKNLPQDEDAQDDSLTKKIRLGNYRSSTMSSGTSLSGNESTSRPQLAACSKHPERNMTTYGNNLPQDEDAQDDSLTKKIRLGNYRSSTMSSGTSLSGNESTSRPQLAACSKHPERNMPTNAKGKTINQLPEYTCATQPKVLPILCTGGDADRSFVNLLIYVSKVTVLVPHRNNEKTFYKFDVDGYSIGEFYKSVDTPTSVSPSWKMPSKTDTVSNVLLPPTDSNEVERSSDHVPNSLRRVGHCGLKAFNTWEKEVRITIQERQFHHLLKSQNLYSINVKRNIFDAAVRLRKNCLHLEPKDELTIRHIQIDKGYLCTEGRKVAKLVKETALAMKSVAKKSSRSVKKVTIREVLSPAGNKNTLRTVSFDGIIVSRAFKVTRKPGSTLHCEEDINEGDLPRLFDASKVSLLLRVKNIDTADEISIYIDLNEIHCHFGLLPGCRAQFTHVQRSLSHSGNPYCNLMKYSSLQLLSASKQDIAAVKNRKINHALSGTNLHLRKYLSHFVYDINDNFRNVTWELRVDFMDVLWASFCWQCRSCFRRVKRGICARGCPQSWKFTCQAMCIIEDGTGEGYLQVEHTLLRQFLSLSDNQWRHIQMVARKDEIIYQRDDGDRITVPTTQPNKQNASQRLSRKRMAKKLLIEMLRRKMHCGSYLVECKIFKDSNKASLDGKLRSIIIGNDEYITKAPRRICLQAICIEKIDSTQEMLNVMESLEEIPQ